MWLASGLLAWTGASSFAELGSSIPVNGGAQAYLQYSYGPLVSYLFAWTAISGLKPGTWQLRAHEQITHTSANHTPYSSECNNQAKVKMQKVKVVVSDCVGECACNVKSLLTA